MASATTSTTCLLLFAVAAQFSLASEEVFDPYAGPKPELVWIESNPWMRVRGAETPQFVLYEDGTAVYVQPNEASEETRTARLDADTINRLKQQCLAVRRDKGLKHYYDITPGRTDQPRAMFCIRSDEGYVTTVVRGLKRPETELLAYTKFPATTEPDSLPESVSQLHGTLADFRAGNAVAWAPKYAEVLISRYENAAEASIPWPEGWPGFDSPQAYREGDRCTLYLPGDKLPDLKALLSTLKPRDAVEIDGEKCSIFFKYAYPSEPVWREAFRESRQARN